MITHEESHVADDECGAPEFFSDGAKLDRPARRRQQDHARRRSPQALARLREGALHQVQPQAISITQATECGMIYTPAEVRALKEAAAPRGLTLHMDGARFANALVTLGCTPAEITWKAGVDVLSFGGTKNGAWAAEAVIFFDPGARRRDEMAAQARRPHPVEGPADRRAVRGTARATATGSISPATPMRWRRGWPRRSRASGDSALAWPCQANEVFPILSPALQDALKAAGVAYLPWSQTPRCRPARR